MPTAPIQGKTTVAFKSQKNPAGLHPGPGCLRSTPANIHSCLSPEKNCIYCKRCGKIINGTWDDPDAGISALMDSCDNDTDSLRPHHAWFLLGLDDRASPWHLNFDHVIPSQPGKYWLACQIINLMKTALSEEEFRAVVIELARHFETGEAYNRDVIRFEYWYKAGG